MHVILIYAGILIGVLLEGEMIMLSSVIAAHRGYLNLWIVLGIGFAGTLSGDWFYFFLGRSKGKIWFEKKQKIKAKVEKITERLQKYPILVILAYRFIYGFRTVTPIIIGTSNIRTISFLTFSLISTSLWCLIYGSLGYLCGEIIKTRLAHIEDVELYIIGFLILTGILIYFIKRRRKYHLALIK
jgi:membrane protein DedA with SNARE-associated domain